MVLLNLYVEVIAWLHVSGRS